MPKGARLKRYKYCEATASVVIYSSTRGVQLTTGHFDGGSTEVPGGVTGPVDRVLIVGAGIAGLTAASALTHAGVERVALASASAARPRRPRRFLRGRVT